MRVGGFGTLAAKDWLMLRPEASIAGTNVVHTWPIGRS